jgi:hypothetical protein
MSAIGSYAVLRREGFRECVRLAADVRTEVSGKWIFQRQLTHGRDEFNAAWAAALVEEVHFEYSGYILGNYLDTQEQVNGVRTGELERSPAAVALHKVFTAAIPFGDTPVPFPVFEEQTLRAFCRREYGDDADGMYQAIQAAHEFYGRGLARVSESHVHARTLSEVTRRSGFRPSLSTHSPGHSR